MKFEPLTDEQIESMEDEREYKRLTDGFADCVIREAAEGVSKSSGSEMITLLVEAEGEHGGSGLIYVYLTLSSTRFAMIRLKSFMRAIGEERKYMSGEIVASSLVGKTFKAVIKQKKDSKYFEVAEFIIPAKQPPAPMMHTFDPKDDDVPF